MQVTDPLGNSTWVGYDLLDKVTQIVEANGALTAFSHDADGNLTSVTDANGGKTAYVYDSMDRPISRTDPLGATESYLYDGNGNLTQHTDRRGKVTAYQYDGLNRRILAGFGQNGGGYESTISYSWDGGNRLTQAVDSIAGTIARTYDLLDSLTDEQTAQGEVSYTFDAASRRQTMQVAGQPQVVYGWDNANRLTGITQGSTSVSLNYDNANRRTSLTLPNGILLSYTYDSDSHVKGMTWTLAGNAVGDLEYNYDADGRVIGKTGSFVQANLPQAVAGNTFNADNEMTAFNGTPLSYDANGNLTNDGTNTYIWDARNHLAGMTGSSTAGFVYDGFGRRAQKTVNGASSQFLYDRWNPVQEVQGGTPSANLMTGLKIDEYFTRTDSAGARDYLTDILGSTLALTDSTGAIHTLYAYDPFGNVTAIGAASTNSYDYTGRENDGTGLYFNRARYYSPTLQRFIAQDPIGFKGGDANLYAFVENNPANLVDRLGLQVMPKWADPDSPEYDPIDWGAVGGAASNPSNQLTAPPRDSGYYCALKPSPPPPPPPPKCPAGVSPSDLFNAYTEMGGLGGAAIGSATGIGAGPGVLIGGTAGAVIGLGMMSQYWGCQE